MKLDILGLGHAIADKTITNDMLAQVMDTSDEWITQRTGIKQRRYSSVNTSQLALNAAKMAIKNANIDPTEIDVVVCATMTADNFTPTVSCMILKELGISCAVAFDVNAACSGFLYAASVAASLLSSLNKQKALVIGADVLSKILDYEDRGTSILFGDGAGAMVIEAKQNDAYFILKAKTDENQVLKAPSIYPGGTFINTSLNNYYLRMDGKEVYKFAITSCEEIITQILEENNMTIDDISIVIPHQANKRIIDSFSKKLNIDPEKIFINLDKYGNTSAASVPIALSEAFCENKIKKGDNILLVGFGAGLTWSAAILKY